MIFGSDNMGAAHPLVLEALMEAGRTPAAPYGDEAAMDEVRATLREIFDAPEAEVFLVATGTGANALALASLVQPWSAIYCSPVAHIHSDECGAPEMYTGGAKLILVDAVDGRMVPEALAAAVDPWTDGDLHHVRPGAVSITQVTERGTVHSLDHLRDLSEVAHRAGMRVHMDGARFANAMVALGCSPAEMTWRAGIDALSFGGTKNGCLGVEAVIFFDPALARDFPYRRKRAAQLYSKHRMLSSQMLAYLRDDLWIDMASGANRMAARLALGLAQVEGARLRHPVEANMIFADLPRAAHRRAVAGGAEYYLTEADLAGGSDDDAIPCRLVTNWATTEDEVDRFLALLDGGAVG